MLMEQFLSITMGMADTFMVSGVGEAAVSSVSLVDSINVLVTQLFAALTGGGAIITSQYLGRRDRESAVRSAAQLYTVSMTATLTLMVVVLVLHRPILRLVFGAIDADVMRMCETYFIITLFRIRLSDCTMQAPRCSGYKATAVSVCLPVW